MKLTKLFSARIFSQYLPMTFEAKLQLHTLSGVRGYPIVLRGVRRKMKSTEQFSTNSPLPTTFVPDFHDERAVRRTTYSRLGCTDMIVSKMSLGCGPLGGLYGAIDHDATEIVQTAIKNGVNYLDTAYWYGQGRSEEVLGKALRTIPRGAYYVATKVGRYEQDYARMFDFRADRVLQSLEDSLHRLQLSYVDVIQIHDVEFAPNEDIILHETLPALEMARQSGKARYIGITGYPLQKLASIIEKSSVKIDVVLSYCRGTLNDSALGEYVPFFQKHNVGIINAASLSMGLLTPQGPPAWHPAPDKIKEACKAAVDYCSNKNISITRLANNYSVNFPGISTGLIGAHTVEMIKENLEASWTDLTELEARVRDKIVRRYFDPLDNAHWEEIEVQKYWKKMKAL